MNKLEIVFESLQISVDGIIILVIPKNACSIDVLALNSVIPNVVIYNKYLANLNPVFIKPLSNCVDSTNTLFTQSSFITFAQQNLGL
jgi:hypothetical protein